MGIDILLREGMGMYIYTIMGMGWEWKYCHGNGREWDRKSHPCTSLKGNACKHDVKSKKQ